MSDNVNVSIKVRPLIKREKESRQTSLWRIRDNTIATIDGNGDPFVFDHIFDETVSTRKLFDTVCRPVILSALNGINGTIFAYGQTSSGKTYTMIGDEREPGVVPLTAREIFEQIKNIKERQFLIRVGFIEIYNEKIHDLLNPANTKLKVAENQCGDVVVNSKECITNCPEQIILSVEEGNKARKIGETNMNERSSRSHTIFRITIESRLMGAETGNDAVQISILNLVDLAGSERADQTGSTGSRFKEGVFINRSLLSLSCVIQKLSENSDKQFINYRDSKLTRILQASLGGNAVTSMICNITPAVVEETYYTLSFAMRAKKIKNKPKVNEILSEAAMMKRLEREIKRLQSELRSEQNKNSKIKLVELQDAITLRTNQIINSSQVAMASSDNARRRTWCPSSSVIPRLSTNGRPISEFIPGHTLMGPPQTPHPCLVSMNGMTPNIAVRITSSDDEQQPQQEKAFRATLALMGDDNDHIAYQDLKNHRDLLARPMCPTTPVANELLNPFGADGDEFIPGELISFGHSPRSPIASMARELHTPTSLRRTRRSSTGDSPTHIDYRKRCRELEQEQIELQEFTKLEKSVEIEYLKQELANRDEALAGLRSDIDEKEQRLEQLEERCTQLESDLKDQQERVSVAENQLAAAAKERLAAVREAELHHNQLTSIEFEYERFRQRSETREKELIESLQEARGLSGIAGGGTPNHGDVFRPDQKREEMKRLEMQNYDFSLQLEECNKQIEQLKSSYLEQHRKLEQVKKTVLHHHYPSQALGGYKSEETATHSVLQALRKLLLSREACENGDDHHHHHEHHNSVHNSSHGSTTAAERTTTVCDGNMTTLGEDQTVDELLKIIETLEANLKASNHEKTTLAESNAATMGEFKSKLDEKTETIERLENQLGQLKQNFHSQTKEYDELSTQLMDQMQDSEELKKEYEMLEQRLITVEAEAASRQAELTKDLEALRETFEQVSKEKAELARMAGTLQEEIVSLEKAIAEKGSLVDTLQQEKRALGEKCDEATNSLDAAASQSNALKAELEKLKLQQEKEQVNSKEAIETLRQELARQEADLKAAIVVQRTEKELLEARLLDQLQRNDESEENKAQEKEQKVVHIEQQLHQLTERLKCCTNELHLALADRERQVQLFSQEKETLENTNEELVLEIGQLKATLKQLKEENDNLASAKRIETDSTEQRQQDARIRELQEEVAGYRKELETVQKEYNALLEQEKVNKETYEASLRKSEEEIEGSKVTIAQLKDERSVISEQETNARKELEQVQLSQSALEKRVGELEEEVILHVKNLEAAHSEHAALAEKLKAEQDGFQSIRLKLEEELESCKSTIARLTEVHDNIVREQSGNQHDKESLLAKLEELEKSALQKDDEICQHLNALEAARKENHDLIERENGDRESHKAAQQKLADEMEMLKAELERQIEEKNALSQEQTEGKARQELLEKQLHELSTGKEELTRQIEQREEEIHKHLSELDTLRTEQIRMVEQLNAARKELEDKQAELEREVNSLQQTVDELMTENEALLREQLEGRESQQQQQQRMADDLEELRSCRDESERLVAQLERDLTTVRGELEKVRSELLEEKLRHDESERSEQARLQSMTEEMERLKCSIVALEDEKSRLQDAEGRLLQQLEENVKRTAELDEKQLEMDSLCERLGKENSDLTIAVQELSAKIVNLEEQMDGNEAEQRKTIDTLVKERQAQADAAHTLEQEAGNLRLQLTESVEKLADLQERHEKVLEELREVKAALQESSAQRERLEADIEESSSVRDVLERELRELKNDLESLDNKLAKGRYEQERQISANLRRELDEKQKELESLKAKGRPSLGDGRVVQALRRENEDLLRQLNEARQIDGLKGKQLQERVDELHRLEVEIARMRDEMATMRHESSFNEKEEQITQLQQQMTEVEKVREETVHQKRSLERAYDQLRSKNLTLAKEVDELRRTTDKERKSRRQSTHDDRRGLLFNSKDVAIMTEPTSTECSCIEMDAKIADLRQKLTLKDCQLNTQKLIFSANPLKNEVTQLTRKIEEYNREKDQLEKELRDVLAELDKERKERKRQCTQCIRHSRQQNARCDKAVQAYFPGETAVSVSIVSTTRAGTGGTPAKSISNGVSELQKRCDEQQEQYERLMEKYQTMKQLCRLRNEKIVSLNQDIAEKENESSTMNRSIQKECSKLKAQLKEAERRYRQSNGAGNGSLKVEREVQTEQDQSTREEMEMYRNKYERYKALAQKLLEEGRGQNSIVNKTGQR